ncbi:putative ribonuclease H-like domain-containing protein, partial [Tanacetum coccineum]
MRPFRYPVTILNTIDHLGKFDGKADEGFSVEYSTNSKAFQRSRPNWLFDIDVITKSMNYKPVVAGNQSNGSAGTKACDNTSKARMEIDSPDPRFKPSREEEKKDAEDPGNEDSKDNAIDENIVYGCADDLNMPELEDIVYSDDAEDVGAEADMNNLDTFMPISPILTTRMHKDHPIEQIIRDLKLAPQTRRMTESVIEHAIRAQEGKRAIGTKWVYMNKKDERGIVIKIKSRLVVQGYIQEGGIDYDDVFAPVTRIEAIRLFLAYASFKDFMVYQIDVKSAFLYGKIEEEVYVCQPLGFEDPDFPDIVYKVENALYGLHQAPRAWYETLSTYLLDNEFQREKIDNILFIRRDT